MNIYFSDLNKETQDSLLKLKKIKDPKELGWDSEPLFEIHENDYEEECSWAWDDAVGAYIPYELL